MMDFHSLASTRRSIRKYTDEDVGVEAILECIDTAVTAPSGCNSQCWKFVVIHNPEMLERLAAALSDKLAELIDSLGLKDDGTYLESKIKMATFFKKAPVLRRGLHDQARLLRQENGIGLPGQGLFA
jgi:nitroreductase